MYAKALGWDCAWHIGGKTEELKGDQGMFWKHVAGHCEGIGLRFRIDRKPFEKGSNMILRGFLPMK